MTPARLAVAVLAGVALAAGVAVLGPAAAWSVQVVTQALAVAGCLAAAAALARGDLLLVAWLATGLSFLVPLASALGRGWAGQGPLAALDPDLGALAAGVIMDAAAVTGAALFVLAYRRAGLARLPGSRRGAGLTLVTVAVGCGAGAALLALDVAATLGHGRLLRGLADGVAAVADAACFALAGPLLRIALAFRGGRLAAPWTFLAACNLGWLAYDGASILTRTAAPGSPAAALVDLVATGSCLAALAAGLLFRAAVAGPSGRDRHRHLHGR
jgi:hypothetical protein